MDRIVVDNMETERMEVEKMLEAKVGVDMVAVN